jgi:probable HAF family extracellular repeat protein
MSPLVELTVLFLEGDRSMCKRCVLVVCVLFLACVGGGVDPALGYSGYYLSEISGLESGGTAWTTTTYGYGINSSGQTAGYSMWSSGDLMPPVNRAWVYTGGTNATMLPVLDGAYNHTQAYGINSSGLVAGFDSTNNNAAHAVTWTTAGVETDLGILDPGGLSRAYAINDSGQVSGMGTPVGGGAAYHALLFSGGSIYDIGTLGGNNGYGYAINAGGKVAGMANDASGASRAFLWTPTVPNGTSGSMVDISPSTATNAWSWGINASGQAVGYANIGGANHAFMYKDGTSYDLGIQPGGFNYSLAFRVNDSGSFVGASYNGTTNKAFVWNPTVANGTTGTFCDLNTLISPANQANWTLTYARDISSNGWITGFGMIGGTTHGFVLKPALPGDATLDGTVNIADLSKVLTNYDKTGAWADGDFNGDGTVNISDLSNVLTNYDQTAGAAGAGIKAVPEPSTAMLVATLAGLLAYAWRKRP